MKFNFKNKNVFITGASHGIGLSCLEIFAKHARTKESKIQIEISRLKYLLPRLMGFWTHFSRQRGGVGVRGGEGEQQIELDRRIIRKRIFTC